MSDILVPVAPGELLDKITILRIKAERISEPAKLANVRHELELLEEIWHRETGLRAELLAEEAELTRVNLTLWEVEDAIRGKEAARCFDEEFIALARSVYRHNDERSALKRRVNTRLGSALVEEKSYRSY